jgi:ferredoxin
MLPYNCGYIARFRLEGIDIDISGCGGVREPLDVIRYLMAGASSVQSCKLTMVEGINVGTELLDSAKSWMERKGYKSVKDIQGIVAKSDILKVDPEKFPSIAIPQIMGGPPPSEEIVLDKKKCISCGWCEEACFHLAIEIGDKYPVIDKKLCEVCGMCVNLCPMRALSIGPRKN